MPERTHIFPGRFQPFHNGHDQVVRMFLESEQTQTLFVGVIFDVPIDDSRSDPHDIQSQEHFLPERNPWSPVQCLRAIDRYLRSHGLDRVAVTMLPRPSRQHSWELIENMFPGNRTWIIPACGETWDDKKARFFEEMGDAVLRIPVSPALADGYQIRTAYYQRRFDVARASVPDAVWRTLEDGS